MQAHRLNYSVLSPHLFVPLQEYRPGDFAVHLAGCIGRREGPKPLRQCEAKLAALANLSRARGASADSLSNVSRVHAQHEHGGGSDGQHGQHHDDKSAAYLMDSVLN